MKVRLPALRLLLLGAAMLVVGASSSAICVTLVVATRLSQFEATHSYDRASARSGNVVRAGVAGALGSAHQADPAGSDSRHAPEAGGAIRTIAGGAPDIVKGGQFERVFATSEGPVGLLGDAEVVDRTFTLRNIAVYPYGAGSLDIGIGGVRAGLRALQEELGGMGYEQLEISGTRLTGANPGRDVFMRFDHSRFWESADAGS